MLTQLRNPAALLTPPYESSTISEAVDDDRSDTHEVEPTVTPASLRKPANPLIIRLPPFRKHVPTVDVGVDAVSLPATCETGTQYENAGNETRDVAMSEAATATTESPTTTSAPATTEPPTATDAPAATAAAVAAAKSLIARIAELETRNRALLAANRKLLQRGHSTEGHASSSTPPVPRAPFGLLLARKYREEGPWRQKCFELIASWADENRTLQVTVGQLQDSNAELVSTNSQLMGQIAQMRQTIEKQQRANQQGSEVLAAERDKIRQLLLENQRIRVAYEDQRMRIFALGEKARRTLELTTPGSPQAQIAVGGANGANQQPRPPTGGGSKQMRPPAEASTQVGTTSVNQQTNAVFAINPPHQRTASNGTAPRPRATSTASTPQIRPATSANSHGSQHSRPHTAVAQTKAAKTARRTATGPPPPPTRPRGDQPGPPQAQRLQMTSPQNEAFERLSLPLQQSLLRDRVAQQASQQTPTPTTVVPPRSAPTSTPASTTSTPLIPSLPPSDRQNTAQGPSQDRRERVLQDFEFLPQAQKHELLESLTPDQLSALVQHLTPPERHQLCPTFFPPHD